MKKYKLFGKIPVFDIVLVAIIVIAAVLIFSVFMSSRSGNVVLDSQTKTVRYKVVFSGISNAVDGMSKEGERVFDFNTNYEIGKVVGSESKPAVTYGNSLETGKVVRTVDETRKDVTVYIEAQATVSERATEINGVKIGIGRSFTLQMPSLCALGTVTNIEEV